MISHGKKVSVKRQIAAAKVMVDQSALPRFCVVKPLCWRSRGPSRSKSAVLKTV